MIVDYSCHADKYISGTGCILTNPEYSFDRHYLFTRYIVWERISGLSGMNDTAYFL